MYGEASVKYVIIIYVVENKYVGFVAKIVFIFEYFFIFALELSEESIFRTKRRHLHEFLSTQDTIHLLSLINDKCNLHQTLA